MIRCHLCISPEITIVSSHHHGARSDDRLGSTEALAQRTAISASLFAGVLDTRETCRSIDVAVPLVTGHLGIDAQRAGEEDSFRGSPGSDDLLRRDALSHPPVQ